MEKNRKITKEENGILVKKRMKDNKKMTKEQAKQNIEKDYEVELTQKYEE